MRICIETGDDPDEHASAPMERKKPETVERAKARLVRELKDYCKDSAAIAAAMKQEPAIAFDPGRYDEIKAELIKRANGSRSQEGIALVAAPGAQEWAQTLCGIYQGGGR